MIWRLYTDYIPLFPSNPLQVCKFWYQQTSQTLMAQTSRFLLNWLELALQKYPPGEHLGDSTEALLMLKILHDLSVLQYYNSQGIRYLGSCRILKIHRIVAQPIRNVHLCVACACLVRVWHLLLWTFIWVAVKELKLGYYIGKPYYLLYIPIMVT